LISGNGSRIYKNASTRRKKKPRKIAHSGARPNSSHSHAPSKSEGGERKGGVMRR